MSSEAGTSADLLLTRLERVKRSGTGWRADCPNGHRTARGTLSITQVEDGRILLHCFACGDVGGVLRALGLEASDLFPERIKIPTPEAQGAARERFKRNAWAAALRVLDREACIVAGAARAHLDGLSLPPSDIDRLALAIERIGKAREVLA